MGSPELTGQHYDPPNGIRFDTLERQGLLGRYRPEFLPPGTVIGSILVRVQYASPFWICGEKDITMSFYLFIPRSSRGRSAIPVNAHMGISTKENQCATLFSLFLSSCLQHVMQMMTVQLLVKKTPQSCLLTRASTQRGLMTSVMCGSVLTAVTFVVVLKTV